MKIEPKPTPTFGWSIHQQCTRYGKSMVKSTEYHRDNGHKLLVMDVWYDGKQKSKTKELYDKSWHLVKQKVIDFTKKLSDKKEA